MSPLDEWVARRNVAAFKRQLDDVAFSGVKVELLRQLAHEELKLSEDARIPKP